MEKDRDRSISVVGSDKSRLFNSIARDAIEREREWPGLCPVVSRRIFECAVAAAEENRKVAGLEIYDGDVHAMVSVEVPGQPVVRAGIRAGVAPRLKRRIAIPQKRRKTVALSVDDQEIPDPVIVEIRKTDSKRASA